MLTVMLLAVPSATAAPTYDCQTVGGSGAPNVATVCDIRDDNCDYTVVYSHVGISGPIVYAYECDYGAWGTHECILAIAAGWCGFDFSNEDVQGVSFGSPFVGFDSAYSDDTVYYCSLSTPAGMQPCPAGTERLLPGPSALGLSDTWGHVLP